MRRDGHPVEIREGDECVWEPHDADTYSIIRVIENSDDHPDVVAKILYHSDKEMTDSPHSMAESNITHIIRRDDR
jgi:hypothetical protein